MASTPRVLFVSYLFPPVGGVGVHRVTKFVKFLPEFGWNSSVLTVSNPSVPLLDDSLTKDIPEQTLIRRARTLEPGYALKRSVSGGESTGSQRSLLRSMKSLARGTANLILQPDAQVLWHPAAYRAGLQLLQETHHDAIIATGPPFSSLLLGARLSRTTGIPLILDYRDEWDLSNTYWENKKHGQFGAQWQQRQQAKVLRAASYVLATTPSSARQLDQTIRTAGSDAECGFIYNGFDPDDFPAESAVADRHSTTSRRFQLAFIGTLWNLNSIQPLVEALLQLQQQNPSLAGEMELLLAGRRTPDQEQLLDRLSETSIQLTRLPFVSHAEAVQLMRSADALLMLNSDLPQTQRIINAKTFEYMAARRPLLVIAPPGDVWDITGNLPGSVLCRPSDPSAIAGALAFLIEQRRCGVTYDEQDWDIARFHRRSLTGELSSILNRLCGRTSSEPLQSLPPGAVPVTTSSSVNQSAGAS